MSRGGNAHFQHAGRPSETFVLRKLSIAGLVPPLLMTGCGSARLCGPRLEGAFR